MKNRRFDSVDVVMLGTFALWNLGTLQARALPFARSLREHGLTTAIVTTPWDMPGEAGVVDVIDNVLIANTESISPRNPLPAVRQQMTWVNDLNPRLIHLMKPKGFGGMAARTLSRSLPLVVDSDDWEGDGGWNDSGNYPWMQRRVFQHQETDLLARADVVTAASTTLADRARALRGETDANVFLIDNGLDAAWAADLTAGRKKPPSEIDPPVVLLYSRFAEFGEDWIPAFAKALVKTAGNQVKLRVVGSIDDTVAAKIGETGINCELHGYVARDRIPGLLGDTTLAVYPYLDSPVTRSKQSVKLLEQLAAGCPLVASDVGDVSRVVGSSGITLNGASPVEFARNIVKLLAQPETLDRMSAHAASDIRDRYSISLLTHKLVAAYRAAGLS